MRTRIEDVMTDPAAEREGKWIAWTGGMEFLIARAGSDEFDRVRQEYLKPYAEQQRFGVLPDVVWQAANRHAYAHAIVKGWRGVFDVNYEPVPYSPEQAEKYLAMPALHDLYDWVVFHSARWTNFKKAALEKDLGNSSGFSTGVASGDTPRSPSSPSSEAGDRSTLSVESPSSPPDSSASGTDSGTSTTQAAA